MNTKNYRDNNNFCRINYGEYTGTRFNPFLKEKNFNYIDYLQGPVWIGTNAIIERNQSLDGGKTFEMVKRDQLFGTFFFLSEDIFEHS